MVACWWCEENNPLRERLFLGGLLKGGISIKQPMIGIRQPGFSTASLRGGEGTNRSGSLCVLVVMRLAHCWVLGQQRKLFVAWFPPHNRAGRAGAPFAGCWWLVECVVGL